jgi:hypothetical protein
MEDNTVVDTDNASASWTEKRESDGSNMIGRLSRSQWNDQTLYRSRKGRYYVEYESRVQGQGDHAEWISPQEAARWLLLNKSELPDDLVKLEAEVSE